MGSFVELNDTLQITAEQGFPKELVLEKHLKKPFTEKRFEGKVFSFSNKEGARIYHPAPTRCFLVHNIGGKWLYWGKILVIEQTINAESKTTSGKFKVIKVYGPEYQRQITINESPEGKSFF